MMFHKTELGSARAAVIAALALGVVLAVAIAAEHRTQHAQASAPSLTLDMDPNTGGIQSSANPAASSEFCVAVVSEQAADIAAFNFEVTYDQTLVDAPDVANGGSALEDNPDMNNQTSASSVCTGVNEDGFLDDPGASWACQPPLPKGDNDGNHGNATGTAFISCFALGSSSAGSGTGVLAYIKFTTGASTGGPITLAIQNAYVSDTTFAELGSCNPVVSVSMTCTNGSVTIGPTPTPSNTPAATDTPTATPTPLPGTVVVNTTADTVGGCPGASCSLRGAISYANANSGTTIVFNIAGGGPHVIALTADLPTITAPTTIDGTSQPGYSTTPLIVIDGGSTGSENVGLWITGGSSTAKGLNIRNINNGSGYGIFLDTNGGNTIQGNSIGTNNTGTAINANTGAGIHVQYASVGNTIGGSTAATRNILSGNGYGIRLWSDGNTVTGNYVGLGADGTTVLANTLDGISIATGDNNVIGGDTAGERNLISGNAGDGVDVESSSTGTIITGNYIGFDATGALSAQDNLESGVEIDGDANRVGGTTAGERNVIGNNVSSGVRISGDNNDVVGNYIGTDAAGTGAHNNSYGVHLVAGAVSNRIGGTTAGARNLLSGNGTGVAMLTGGVSNNTVQGNYIGTTAAGTAALANNFGIYAGDTNGQIGGTAAGAGNVISGNTSYGIFVDASGNAIEGNTIGLGSDGSTALGNASNGIRVNSGTGTTIGGSEPGARNIVSSNAGGAGIIAFTGSNVISGNYVGVAADGTTARGNTGRGIYVAGGSTLVGGVGQGNIVANNSSEGVLVDACSPPVNGVQIRGNSIYNNFGVGVVLVCGANAGIAAPTITAATFPPQGTTCASCWIDVYSGSDAEGRTYHGSTQADGAGNWKYWDRVDGPNVTAIATDGSGNSSAFSSTLTRAACSGVCTEGLWENDFTGTSTSHCTSWNNQSGLTSIWGHVSCTNGAEFDYDGSLNQGLLTVALTTYYITPVGFGGSAAGTFTPDGSTVSGTWLCNIVCAGSGGWTGQRYGSTITIPAGGGSAAFVPGVPAATVLAPAGSPEITVNAVPLQDIATTVMRTGFDFKPNGLTCEVADPCTPVQLTVTFVAATDLPPAPATCADLAQYEWDPGTSTSTFESRIACNVGQNMFTTPIRSFSVHRFEVGRDTDGDGIDDGVDVCPLVIDAGQNHSDAHILDFGILKAYDDVTMPWGDDSGDACDSDGDRDNDGLTDAQEAVGCGFGPTNPVARDSDGDLYLDKAECQLATNPNQIALKPTFAACGSTADPDNDGLLTAREFCYYGTDPNNPNSDGQSDNIAADTCKDGQEVANLNGDFQVSAIDLSQLAQSFGPYTLPGNAVQRDFDFTKDGQISSTDLSQVAQRFSPSCQSFAAP